jgi:polyhydroxybutyrate depolymerase
MQGPLEASAASAVFRASAARAVSTGLLVIGSLGTLVLAGCGDDPAGNSDPSNEGGVNTADGGTVGSGSDGSVSSSQDGGAGAADGSSHVPAGSCGVAGAAVGFIAKTTVMVGGASRTYALTVPAGYDGTKLYPLIVGFHGDGGNGAGYRGSFKIEDAAHTAGGDAIFAWPDGTNNNNGHSFDQDHDPPANKDVDFFEALVKQVSTTYCVDSKKLFIHGMSGGAYFVNQLARWKASEIKGAAPQSGGGPFGITAADFTNGQVSVNGPVPVFIVHGDADGTVSLSEGMKSYTYWQGADKTTAGTTAGGPSPCVKQNGGVAPVYFCKIPGMGHTIWTGSPAGIWQFYSSL